MTNHFVVVTDSPSGEDLSIERAVLTDMRVEKISYRDQESLIDAVREADGILCTHAPFTETVIQALSRCKVIARYGTGLDNISLEAAEAAGIPVEGVHDYCTQEVADQTLALLLAWNRKILHCHHFVWEKRWNERKQTTGNWGCQPMFRLSGQTLGVVGLGHIGRAVAGRARAFGMTVLGYMRRPDPQLAEQIGFELTPLEDLLSRSDYVSLHIPLQEETHHFLNVDRIKIMKPGAILINTSRGGLIDDDALVEALREGRLGGALLDVYQKAPLPVDHPFRTLSNVILTPHVGFYSEGSLQELRRLAAEAVRKHLT